MAGRESGLAETFNMFGRGVPLEQGARSQVCWSQHLAGVCYLMSESGGGQSPFWFAPTMVKDKEENPPPSFLFRGIFAIDRGKPMPWNRVSLSAVTLKEGR